MATPYQRGRSFEYRVKKKLESLGYFVMRSAGSKGQVDLLAVKHGTSLFVQSKLRGQISITEHNELFLLSQRFGSIPVIVMNSDSRKIIFLRIIGLREPYKRKITTEVLSL